MPKEEIVELINLLLSKASESTLVAILLATLLATLFGIYVVSRVYVITEIRAKNTSQFMAHVDDEFYAVSRSSRGIFHNIWKTRAENDMCKNCIHPLESFHGNIMYNLCSKLKLRVKQRWHENGFLKMTEYQIRQESIEFGKRLRNINQSEMEHFSVGLHTILVDTHDERFTERQTIELMERIFRFAVDQKKMEKDQIRRAITLRKEKV